MSPSDFDHRWLARLTARHRILFDVHAFGEQATPLNRAANFFDTMRDAYAAKPGEAQVVLSLHGSSAPIAFNDAAWEKYALGERMGKVATDPLTAKPAVRNIFASEATTDPWSRVAVPALQRRGAIFLFCNNVMRFLSTSLARKRNEAPDAVRADLIASFLPGVVLVPAVVAATAMAQEHGCSYALIK
ncbi:MAG: hypothetical protein V4558_01685 [Gemmatimonadota bacterium]